MSDKLRDARIRAGLTMQDVASAAKVSRSTMDKAEKGDTISQVFAIRIVNALNELAETSYTVQELEIKTGR